MTSYRIRYRTLRGHVHAHFWSSESGPNTTHGKNGELVFRVGEDWEAFKALINRVPKDPETFITFINEDEESGC